MVLRSQPHLEHWVQPWNTHRVVRATPYFAYLGLITLAVILAGCVAKPGNIHRLIALPRVEPQPVRPHSPAKPEKFPPVSLVWERTHDKKPTIAWHIQAPRAPGLLAEPTIIGDGTPAKNRVSLSELSLEPPEPEVVVGRTIGSFWLPPQPENALEQRFDRAAERALRALVDIGRDDPAILQSLTEKLQTDENLEGLRSQWLPALVAARDYAQATRSIREPLRLLRRAFRSARFDEYYGIYRGLDIASCRWAARRSIELLPAEYNESFQVVIRGLGRHPLSSVGTLCDQALTVELTEREFPAIKGRRSIRRLVQRAYEKAHPELRVHQVSVPVAWQTDGNGYLLKAVIGVERDSNFPQTQCTIEEVELAARNKRAIQKPDCCEVIQSLPVNCDQLK